MTHSSQLPQRGSIGVPVLENGKSVRTVVHLTRGPYCGVMRRQLLPIHPSPARWAAILCENMAQMRWSSILSDAGTGMLR